MPEVQLNFAKIVFTVAAIWGFIVTLPLYFLFDTIGRQSPPAINHPEFYYAFVGVTVTWQVVFLFIGIDPQRYRLIMIPAILEKLSYVLAITVLFFQHKLSVSQAAPCVSDLILAILFVVAFFKTTPARKQPPTS
jgi:hypothetical protein